MPALIPKGEYPSKAALGQAIIKARPELAGRNPEELADKLLSSPAGGGISVAEKSVGGFLGNLAGDLPTTLGEEVLGLAQTIAHPIDTAVSLGKVAGGGIDKILGTDISSPESRMAAQAVYDQFVKDFSAEGLYNRPVRAAVNVASVISPKAGAAIGGKARMLASLGKAGKIGYRGAEVVEALHRPAGAALDVTRAAGRGAGQIAERIGNRISEASLGEPGKLGRMTRDTVGGFMSGEGERAVHEFHDVVESPAATKAFERARDLSGAQASPVTVAGRAKPAADVIQDEILDGIVTGYHNARKSASLRYRRGIAQIKELDNKIQDMPFGAMPFMEALRTDLDTSLERTGIRLIRDSKTGRWGAEINPAWNTALEPEKRVIRAQLGELANFPETGTLRELDANRQRLDRMISGAPTDGQLRNTLAQIRGTVSGLLKDVAGRANPRYLEVLDRYAKANNRLDLAVQEFGLADAIDASGMIHWSRIKRGPVMTQVLDAFADTADRRYIRPQLLRELEQFSGKRGQHLSAKVLGTGFARGMGRGLVQRGQASSVLRAAGTLAAAPVMGGLTGGVMLGVPGAVAGVLGGMLIDLPIGAMYSPRLGSAIMIRLSKFGSTPPNPGVVRRAAAALTGNAKRLLNNPTTGPIIRAGMQEGWSLGKTLEVLQERGIDVEGILNPEKRKAKLSGRPTMLKNLSRANPQYMAR